MQHMMTIKEAAKIWGISTRRIVKLCTEGRIPGAVKEKKWLIPVDTMKPLDMRVKNGEFVKGTHDGRLPLPIGVSDYKKAVTDYYYVDKTLLIKEFLDERAQVSLFTRPRRFGKTLNMDMLKTFFEISEEDTSVYFTGKNIWKCGQKYRDYQGKYPVIFISFK
ncbi:MAG: AAA family ATPase, partial [Erysipelotrichaceae bacterium]|nr:AAA family ATPase [Erysipelotrichaceae bacterium]